MTPQFSIVIPTCHRNDSLRICLDSFEHTFQSYAPKDYEIIVSDDGVDSNAKEVITNDYSWCRWLEGPKKGPGQNRNHGAKYASFDWLLFIDDDCIPEANILKCYCDAIQNNPGIRAFEGSTFADRKKRSFNEEAPINTKGGYFFSCNILIHKSLFQKFDGFDEDFFFHFEDLDFYKRLRNQNENVLFVKDSSVIHPWREKKPLKFESWYLNQYFTYIEKHQDLREKFTFSSICLNYLRRLKALFYNCLKYYFRGFGSEFLRLHYGLIYQLYFYFFRFNK